MVVRVSGGNVVQMFDAFNPNPSKAVSVGAKTVSSAAGSATVTDVDRVLLPTRGWIAPMSASPWHG